MTSNFAIKMQLQQVEWYKANKTRKPEPIFICRNMRKIISNPQNAWRLYLEKNEERCVCIRKYISKLLQPRFCNLASTLLILNTKRFSSYSLLERYVHTYKCLYLHNRYKATHLHANFDTVVNICLISMFWVFSLCGLNAILINK